MILDNFVERRSHEQNERRKSCSRSAATDVAWPCYIFLDN
jgi:hypothetical protein